MTEPVNNKWIDEIMDTLVVHKVWSTPKPFVADKVSYRIHGRKQAKAAILSKLESIEQEAYKKGSVDGGIEILNASCEVCHAYPMTAGCNNANCHAIER